MKELKILGAGPAGLTAAINLAREGYEVTVFEKEKECGMRFHGDLQGLENWSSRIDILDEFRFMNIESNFYYEPIFKCEFYDFELNKREIMFKKPGLYLVKRGDVKDSLDLGLKERALSQGVKIVFNRKAVEKEVDIIAGGPSKVDGIVRGMVFETEMENVSIIILNDDLAPKAFAYLLTSQGTGCLGTGLFKNYQMANEYFKKTLKAFDKIIDLDVSNERMFTGYGNFFLNKSYEKNGKLIIGEAAGLQDYLLAFGIRQAITSGHLAAKSIIENKSYDGLIKQRFEKQLKTSLANRFLFNLLGNKGYQSFLKKGEKIGEPIKRMYKQYNSSFLKEIVLPIARIALKK